MSQDFYEILVKDGNINHKTTKKKTKIYKTEKKQKVANPYHYDSIIKVLTGQGLRRLSRPFVNSIYLQGLLHIMTFPQFQFLGAIDTLS